MNLPWKITLFLLSVILILYVLFAFRTTPAEAQDTGTVELLLESLNETLESDFGIAAQIKIIGQVSDHRERTAAAFSLSQPFAIAAPEAETIVTSPALIESFPTEAWNSLREEMTKRIAPDWLLVSVSSSVFSGSGSAENAYIVSSPSGDQLLGVLFEFSKIVLSEPITLPLSSPTCTPPKVLTLNVLRKPAEQIEACMRANCSDTAISSCELTGTIAHTQSFAEILVKPEAPFPADLHSESRSCSAFLEYEVAFFKGGIDFIVSLDWTQRMSGALTPVFFCDGGAEWLQ